MTSRLKKRSVSVYAMVDATGRVGRGHEGMRRGLKARESRRSKGERRSVRSTFSTISRDTVEKVCVPICRRFVRFHSLVYDVTWGAYCFRREIRYAARRITLRKGRDAILRSNEAPHAVKVLIEARDNRASRKNHLRNISRRVILSQTILRRRVASFSARPKRRHLPFVLSRFRARVLVKIAKGNVCDMGTRAQINVKYFMRRTCDRIAYDILLAGPASEKNTRVGLDA